MTPTEPSSSVMHGLRSRLLVMLLVPLVLLLCISAWLDYRAAGSAALLQDQAMQRLVPLLTASIVADGAQPDDPPIVLLTPAIEDFILEKEKLSAWGLATLDGRVLIGPSWLATPTPATSEPEFHSELVGGTVFRIMAVRADTAAGEYVLMLADGSNAQQGWLRSLLLKVLLPNGLLIAAVAFAVSWAVARALKPLTLITEAVQQRSPSDLSELDASPTPQEVRPLVDALNRLFELLRMQSDAQRRFIADAAHQLRTPLAGLQTQVEAWVQAAQAHHGKNPQKPLIAGKNTAPNAINLGVEELLRLRDATRRTSQLANRLLALSRADSHSMATQPMQNVDLGQLCKDVLEQYLDLATQLDIDLGVELEAQQPMIAVGHTWLLRELLSNLTDNAIRYTSASHKAWASKPLSGHVTLIAKPHESGFMLQVCDNGCGIAPQERSKVLERFYRLPGTTEQGNGLGLAIALEIAKLHHANLHLDDADADALSGQRGLLVSVYLHAATRIN